MGRLTFALNVTLDGCCDHREGVADDALHRYYTRLMDEAGGMLFGRVTYELMESQHVPRRGEPAGGDRGAQATHATRPASGKPEARGRARADGADRRVPPGGAPGPGGARADAVCRPEPVVAHEAPRRETLQVRRDGAALPPEIGRAGEGGGRASWVAPVEARARTESLRSISSVSVPMKVTVADPGNPSREKSARVTAPSPG